MIYFLRAGDDGLGDLVAAIQASNARYVRQEKEIGEMHAKIDALSRAVADLARIL